MNTFAGLTGIIIFLLFLIVIALMLVSCVKIVPQAQALVVERLGAYLGTWSVGVHFLVPFVDRVAKRVILKEQVVDFAPQPVITKDNVTMRIDTVVFFQITDPKLFAYGVLLKAAGALVGIVADKRLVGCIERTADAVFLTLRLAASGAACFLILIAVVICLVRGS